MTKEEKRAALDRIVSLAKEVRDQSEKQISIYDCAAWLLYACARSDAIDQSKEKIEDEDDDDWRADHTVRDELGDTIDLFSDDFEACVGLIQDQIELGEELDPGIDKPIRDQEDWL